jgi:hypothetical protein
METMHNGGAEGRQLAPGTVLTKQALNIFDSILWKSSAETFCEAHAASIPGIVSLVEYMLTSRPSLESKPMIIHRLKILCHILEHNVSGDEHLQMYHDVPEVAPRLIPNLRLLRTEHDDFVHQLEQLLIEADDPTQLGLDWSDRVCALARRVRQHERAEALLLQEAYWDDLGGQG